MPLQSAVNLLLQATSVIKDGPSKKIKQAPVFLDLGTSLGYNAIKMGIHAAKCNGHVYALCYTSRLQQASNLSALSYTIESDEARAFAAKTIIQHAGLSKIVTVIQGVAADVIPNLKRDFGVAIVDLMFLDHSAASYVSDVAIASSHNYLAAGANLSYFCNVSTAVLKLISQDPALLQITFCSLVFLATLTR
jgi:predicted O-methyltransferase YrrM